MRVYLSSSFYARENQTENQMDLREDLRQRGQRLGVDVLLGEKDPKVHAAKTRDDALGILEGCARLMASSDAFFGLLVERHGTGITLEHDPVEARASVSFFEAELLNASMTRKPILVAQAEELRPGIALEEFLQLVSGSLSCVTLREAQTWNAMWQNKYLLMTAFVVCAGISSLAWRRKERSG